MKYFLITILLFISPALLAAEEPAESGSSWSDVGNSIKTTSGKTWAATKATSKRAWQATKEGSGEAWQATKEGSNKAWAATKDAVAD